MSARSRPLPGQPSLRYLKLEAKRRLADGEFATLHNAQVAIAREHGHSSWAALKRVIDDPPEQESRALNQVRWVIARFCDAGEPGWTPPGDDELRRHFDDQLLAQVPAAALVASISPWAVSLRGDLVVTDQEPLALRAQIGGLEVFATLAADPPTRRTG